MLNDLWGAFLVDRLGWETPETRQRGPRTRFYSRNLTTGGHSARQNKAFQESESTNQGFPETPLDKTSVFRPSIPSLVLCSPLFRDHRVCQTSLPTKKAPHKPVFIASGPVLARSGPGTFFIAFQAARLSPKCLARVLAGEGPHQRVGNLGKRNPKRKKGRVACRLAARGLGKK